MDIPMEGTTITQITAIMITANPIPRRLGTTVGIPQVITLM